MKIKCLLVDDEPLAINVVQNHLKKFEDFESIGTCDDAVKAFNFLKKNNPDVIFLDINMPEISGMDLLKTLDKPPLVIITTAYREYAVEGFELNVFDYVVKPIAFSRFTKTVNKIRDHYKQKNAMFLSSIDETDQNFIFIKADKKMVKVFLSDILFVESLKDYVRVVTTTENYITHQNLGNFTAMLPPDKFLRIHRSYTVSLAKIMSLEGNDIAIGNKKLPIGRNYQSEIKKQILNQI